ncbi:hypothetical protein AGDE_14974 [Angomonas deanei]|uniref:Uncharacterized protein n=1 Tax=Angomonas deanei TaxID=59799 RepID=A0A7G2CCF5_9TRYP|nr:hypothetical protein AGDE_14974 [Angomonas deanei]CAD2217500.1 hypothetical protein, conserved [Angomonas deanei]|eukprot:EPY19900.1 hypothetical protein AGDE_14974 [Angomonas deanei]
MERSVQSALYRCSRDAHFFPLWAYDATYASGTQLSKKATAPSSGIFSMVDEKNTPASPGIVERRLFAMAMKQHRALDLAVGCFVQLLTGVKVLDGTRGGSSLVPRGTVCQVVEFIRIAPDTQLDQAPFHVPAAYHDLVLKYVNDNLDAPSVLPLVKIVNEDTIPQGGTTLSFLLYPTPSLIGGLPSLHHYALPVLHLPVLVLTVAAKYHATSMRRTTIPRRHLTLPFYSSDLYHPYYVDECILNDDVLSADKRVIVMEDLVDNFSSKAGRTPFWLAEDIFYELVESDRSGTENDTNAVHATRLHCQLLTEVSLFIDS